MTSLDPTEILYGELERAMFLPDPDGLHDSNGALLYRHTSENQLRFGRNPYPAIYFTDRRGIKTWDEALEQGAVHRLDGPAALWADGREAWYRYGELHREDGPARLTHHDHHDRLRKLYYLEGRRVSEADWKMRTRIRNGSRWIP